MNRFFFALGLSFAAPAIAEDWPQFMFNAAHSGNAAQIDFEVEKLGLQDILPAIYSSLFHARFPHQ